MWRHVPVGAHPLDFHWLIHAGGRWNRRGRYGCLYTALDPGTALQEYGKHFIRRGLSAPRDLVAMDVGVDPVLDVSPIALGDPDYDEIQIGEADPGAVSVALHDASGRGTRANDALMHLFGDAPEDLEWCRALADRAREIGYLAILAPSAAGGPTGAASVLAIYPENRPDALDLRATDVRIAVNHGPDPLLDSNGRLRRPLP